MSFVKTAGLIVLAATLGIPNTVRASAYEFTSSPVITNDSANYTLGVRFTTNTEVLVTQLGYYDYLGDGLNQSHNVGIFDGGGNLLTSTTVPSGVGTTLTGHYRYVSLPTPFALAANSLYVIAGVNSGTADAYAYGPSSNEPLTGFVVDPSISIADGAARYAEQNGTTLQFPTSVYIPYKFYGGANFQIAVPEPASLALITSALTVGWVGRSLRRRMTS